MPLTWIKIRQRQALHHVNQVRQATKLTIEFGPRLPFEGQASLRQVPFKEEEEEQSWRINMVFTRSNVPTRMRHR